MLDHFQERIRSMLVRRLALRRSLVHRDARLREDLGLDALDVLFVLLQLDELPHHDLPFADLDSARTVTDLARMAAQWHAATERERAPQRPTMRASGTYRVALATERARQRGAV